MAKSRLFVTLVRSLSNTASNGPKPFEDIPSLPGRGLPFLGHLLHLSKQPAGVKRMWENVDGLRKKYLKADELLLRLNLPPFNPLNGRVVILFDPDDAKEVYAHEGKFPLRGPPFDAMLMMRDKRPDIYSENRGLLLEDGEKWYNIRTKVQQDLLRPKSAHFYLDSIQSVAQELVDIIRAERTLESHEISDSVYCFKRYAFEAISLIALDTRLGCLKAEIDPKTKETFEAFVKFSHSSVGLLFSVPTWRFLPPRWNKHYRQGEDAQTILLDFNKHKVLEAIERFKAKETDKADHEKPVLEKLIKKLGHDSTLPIVTAIEMLVAGVDTTSNTLGMFLYHLAINPDKQDKLRQEFMSLGTNLTVKDLDKMKYFRACLQEHFRLIPVGPSTIRMVRDDCVIKGYQIPKDTVCLWFNSLFGRDASIFENPEQFLPERWLEKKKTFSPFAVRPFGHGPRMCIGKRFAELELQVATHKILTNFAVKWKNPGPLTYGFALINQPDQKMHFQFEDLRK